MRTASNEPAALVAMSGGVDSTVAAALLLEEGLRVEGVTLRLKPSRLEEALADADADVAAARRACERLGITHHVIDAREQFMESVMRPFAMAYAAGRTPNPCVHCNPSIKFGPLLELAWQLGASALATGHYARVEERSRGRHGLLRGRDRGKDQSYFLYRLTRDHLRHVRFPLGDYTKEQTRDVARRLGLENAERADSQEICFAGEGSYSSLVEMLLADPPAPGPIRHLDGRSLGRHGGIHRFTVGQRKGLGVATGEPLYVVNIDPLHATVTVGSRADLERSALRLVETTWVDGAPPIGVPVTVRIRHGHRGVAGVLIEEEDGEALVSLDEPVTGPAPGQAMVLYESERVLGGGTLREAR